MALLDELGRMVRSVRSVLSPVRANPVLTPFAISAKSMKTHCPHRCRRVSAGTRLSAMRKQLPAAHEHSRFLELYQKPFEDAFESVVLDIPCLLHWKSLPAPVRQSLRVSPSMKWSICAKCTALSRTKIYQSDRFEPMVQRILAVGCPDRARCRRRAVPPASPQPSIWRCSAMTSQF